MSSKRVSSGGRRGASGVETRRWLVVDDFGDEQSTATISLDGLLFTRLAGGRTAVDHDAVTYSGDEAVGKRIVEHLNYVI